jgi:hypothetical protein
MITFKYKKEKSRHGELIYRPVADMVLQSENYSVEVSMYIDSGADVSLIPLSIGLALGFTESEKEIKQIKGIGGEAIPYILKEANFVFSNFKFKARIGWALIEEIPILLGRLDVFSRFKVIFDESEKLVFFIPKR